MSFIAQHISKGFDEDNKLYGATTGVCTAKISRKRIKIQKTEFEI